MTESSEFLNYTGPVDYNKIDILLNDLKESGEFLNIDKDTGKRVYAIVVECLENIIKYSIKDFTGKLNPEPAITVIKQKDIITIKAGNAIEADETGEIILNIDKINSQDDNALSVMFENKINKSFDKDDKGAGLGLMLMKLKSGNNISFNVTRLDNNYNYLELIISVNENMV
jgi:hypothetical protein